MRGAGPGRACGNGAGRGGAAHSIGTRHRRIRAITRKRPGVQRWWNPPMCRAGPSAHGSPCTKNRHFRNNLGIMRKTRDWPAGAPLSDVQYPAISGTPRRVRVPGAAGTGGRGPRPGRRARAGGRDGERGPVNREEWRSGRIVPPRTRRPLRRSRGIMRMSPGASGARRRTILPERRTGAGGGSGPTAIDSAGRLGATLPP